MKMITSINCYIQEAISELKKVVWPTKQETTNHTFLVIGVSAAVAAFLGLIDYFLSSGIEKILTQ